MNLSFIKAKQRTKALLISLLLIIPHISFAKNTNTLTCPIKEAIPTTEVCQNAHEKTFITPQFQLIGTEFQKKFTKSYKDNISHPNFVVSKTLHNYREYRECLFQVCETYSKTCSQNQKTSQSKDYLSSWCLNTADQLVKLQKDKIEYFLTQNQSNKKQALLQGKFDTLGERFMNFIQDRYINILTQTERFEAKVNALILAPKK